MHIVISKYYKYKLPIKATCSFSYHRRKTTCITVQMYLSPLHTSHQFVCVEVFPPSHITKTYLYNFGPLKPHFYIVKLGFTGVYIIFLISAQNIDYGYSLEPPRRGGSNEYPQSMFWAEIWKISEFFIWFFFLSFWNRRVFVMSPWGNVKRGQLT